MVRAQCKHDYYNDKRHAQHAHRYWAIKCVVDNIIILSVYDDTYARLPLLRRYYTLLRSGLPAAMYGVLTITKNNTDHHDRNSKVKLGIWQENY